MIFTKYIAYGLVSGFLISSLFFYILQKSIRRTNRKLQSKNDILMIIARAYENIVNQVQVQYNQKKEGEI